MTTVYKLTRPDLTTYNGYQWALGETRTFPGTGDLCGPGWCHAYTHPLLAILLNPIHADFPSVRLFEGEGIIGRTDHGLKVGCSSLRLTKELLVPAITREHRVRFAIFCALVVYPEPSFVAWAEDWLSGADRSDAAAETAARAAARAAAWAAETAAWAAWAAETAARAAETAARTAETAARAAKEINLGQIVEAACADLLYEP